MAIRYFSLGSGAVAEARFWQAARGGGAALHSQDEYLERNGQCCPRCDGDRLNFHDSMNDFGTFVEEVECEDCGLGYRRVFELAGFEVTEPTNGTRSAIGPGPAEVQNRDL